jgi:hypothetical protein
MSQKTLVDFTDKGLPNALKKAQKMWFIVMLIIVIKCFGEAKLESLTL